jgi:hypothetical protein
MPGTATQSAQKTTDKDMNRIMVLMEIVAVQAVTTIALGGT